MIPQTQVTEVRAELSYEVAHHAGPTYTGPGAGYYFVNGLLDEVVPGWRLLQNSMVNQTHFWELRPDHALSWDGDAWKYRPAPKPAPVAKVPKSVKVPAPAKPDKPKADKPAKAKRKPGRPRKKK